MLRTAFHEGCVSADKHLKSCAEKRQKGKKGKKAVGRNHKWHEGVKDAKPNKWVNRNTLFRDSESDAHAAMTVNGHPPSLYVGKDKKTYMNLPGTGKVELLISMKRLQEQITLTKKDSKYYETNIVSYRLVENTKKITEQTTDSNRTYKLHLSIRVPKPEKTDRDAVVGLDGGVENTMTADNGKKCSTHQIPRNCIRSKNDEISKQQAKRDKHVYKSNRWCKEDRKLKRMIKKLNNTRTEHENLIAKLLVMMAGVIVLEMLDIKSMISHNDRLKKGLNRAIYSAGMGRMVARIRMTAENMEPRYWKFLHIIPVSRAVYVIG